MVTLIAGVPTSAPALSTRPAHAANQVKSMIKPRADVTIICDKALGIPHVYGTTRSGTEFGAGYAVAQDRLWLMDLFRHLGRGQLSGSRAVAARCRTRW
ncbi:penicillin acylase family protein [Actinosynnema sp. NPDC023587]|uniref:penicillin acylase family protein n=1 Tax=Actinosynnema sp. NPDC023587 TaxID=3154695 RepID=UPI0033E85329